MIPTTPPTNPYVGPRTFSYEQRDLFFGREREARDLLARVLSERLLLFYAQSGAGKSSLLHTRLIPQLREEKGFAVLPVGRVGGDLPAGLAYVDNIYAFNLMTSIDQGDDPAPFVHLSLSDFLARLVLKEDNRWLYDASAVPVPESGSQAGRHYAVIVDQFEEIITAHSERWQEREVFFRQFNQAMLDDPNLWVVLTLREDYVAALDPYAPLMADRLRARFYMERMGAVGALEAVRRPAELEALGDRRRPFAAGVAEQLVDNLRQMRVPGQQSTVPGPNVEPVQLQVVCYQLWENLASGAGGTEITLDDLAQAGDVDRALTQYYEDTVKAVLDDPAASGVSERQLRTWFDEQVITAAGTRGLVHQSAQETGGLPNLVVEELQKRFMVRAETRSGDTWIELVHDRFVEPILAANRQWRAVVHNPLTAPTEAWLQAQRDSKKLLEGNHLADAERFVKKNPRLIADDELQFLTESRTRARRRRIQALAVLAVMAVLAALSVVALLSSSNAKMQSRRAQSHDLAARAQAQLSGSPPNPSLALLLASEAISVTWQRDGQISPFVGDSLLNTMSQVPGRPLVLPRHRHAGSINFAGYSPDGSLLLTTGQDGTAKVWMANDGELVATLSGHDGPVTMASFSPDGAQVVTASEDRTARLWTIPLDRATRNVTVTEHKILEGHDGVVHSALFSPDGNKIVTSSDDGTVRTWSASTGNQESILEQQSHKMLWASFSPDGDRIVTAGEDGTATIWDSQKRSALATLEGHVDWIRSAFFSPDQKHVVTASDDGTVRLWDASTGALLLPPFAVPAAAPWAASANFSPDGRWIAAISSKKTGGRFEISVWNAETGAKAAAWTGHVSMPRSVAFDPAGARLVTAGGDKALVWQLATDAGGAIVGAKEVPILDGHGSWMRYAAFSPDGKRLVTAGDDWQVKIWDAATGTELNTLSGHTGWVGSAVYSPDGQQVLTASNDGTARLWDATTASPAGPVLKHVDDQGASDPVFTARFSPDGLTIASGTGSGTVVVWDASNCAETWRAKGHQKAIRSVAFSPDGTRIVTAGADGAVKVWDAATGKQAAPESLVGHTGVVFSARYSPDGSKIVTTSQDGTIKVWDASTGKVVKTFVGHGPGLLGTDGVIDAAFNPDLPGQPGSGGTLLATAGLDGTVKVWDLATGKVRQTLTGHTSEVRSVNFSPDGAKLVTAGGDRDGTVRVWDLDAPRYPRVLSGHKSVLRSAAFSPDGKRVVTGASYGEVKEWDAATGKLVLSLPNHSDWVNFVTFSPDGKRILTLQDTQDPAVRLWDVETGESLPLVLKGHQPGKHRWSAMFNGDGSRIVTASEDGTARIWDAETGDPVTPPLTHPGKVLWAEFSPEGSQVVTASEDRTAKIWDAQTGAILQTLAGHADWVRSASFSPDGKQVVTASYDDTARIWDVSSGRVHRTLSGHTDDVRTAVFSPDGKFVLTASDDGTARVWDAKTGSELFTAAKHEQPIRTAFYSPDGKTVVTASDDKTAVIWPATIEGQIEAAKQLIQRDPPVLTPGERRRYGLD